MAYFLYSSVNHCLCREIKKQMSKILANHQIFPNMTGTYFFTTLLCFKRLTIKKNNSIFEFFSYKKCSFFLLIFFSNPIFFTSNVFGQSSKVKGLSKDEIVRKYINQGALKYSYYSCEYRKCLDSAIEQDSTISEL